MNITEDKLKAGIQIALGTLGLYTEETEVLLIHHIKALTIPVVGCSLPSKKDTMLFAIEYTKTEMPEFNETDKICFRAGVLNMHTWISENKIKQG